MGNVCSSHEEHTEHAKMEFPVDMEILGDYNVFDEFPLVSLDIDTLTEDLLRKGSSFRAKPKLKRLKRLKRLKSLKSLKSLNTPSSMPPLSSRWGGTQGDILFFDLNEGGKGCEDSDSKSVVSDSCVDSDSKSVVSELFEDFYSLTSQHSVSDVSEDEPRRSVGKWPLDSMERRSTKYDMNNWVWKPEEDRISRTCRTDSPPGIPRLSRMSPGPGRRFPSKCP